MYGGNRPNSPSTAESGEFIVRSCPVYSACRRGSHSARGSGRKQLFDPLGRRGLINPLDRRELPNKTIECCLVNLALAVGLLGLTDITIEIADHLGDRTGVAGSDLGLIFLGTPAPHGPFCPRTPTQLPKSRIHLLSSR